ncbi:Chaperone protein dnaJ 2 [Porphyridium purpureum]|uniref:Chaperone protein dnaJ 2 n=1 Tax=Porphyridium purpureum TaxID=35688 RepID=A0A5J4YRY8_PORPP|nr:Chaperone protein dnaJ 2 [Porphyridium purpureum]|eukprot:POR7916..scf236_6
MRRASGKVDNDRFYKILGVDRDAGEAELKKAYKRKAVRMHPDKGGNAEEFQELSHAFEVLSDPEKRQIYDRYGEEALKEGAGGGMHDANDIFEAFFGGGMGGMFGGSSRRRTGPKKSEAVSHAIKVTLEDLYKGKTSKIAITRHRVCQQCAGRGASSSEGVMSCSTCNGRGMMIQLHQIAPGMVQQVQAICPDCRGQGESIAERYKCDACKAQKVVKERKLLEVHVDPGMEDGQKIVFRGEADEEPGTEPGDVIIFLKQVEHERFQRNGRNLLLVQEISLVDALCGAPVVIKHLDGRELVAHPAPGEVIKPNDVKTIPNEGMPTWKSPFEKGYLFVKFTVVFPEAMDSVQMEALQKVLGPKSSISMSDHHEDVELMDYRPEQEKFARANGNSSGADGMDEEEGSQRVQCAQQ